MTKQQLCRHMVHHFRARASAAGGRPLSRADAQEFLEELQRICVRELASRGSFSITGVVKLVMHRRKERRGRDAVSGRGFVIPPRRVVRARISSLVRRVVEGPP